MKKRIAIVAVVALFFAVGVGTLSAAWFTDQVVKVGKYLTVGTSSKLGKATVQNYTAADDVLHLRMATSQTGDALDITDSSGTTVSKIDKDGDLTAVQGTFSGTVTMGTTLTLSGALASSAGIAETYQVAVDQDDTLTDIVALSISMSDAAGQTADAFQILDGTTELLSMDSDGVLAQAGNMTIGGTLALTGNQTNTANLTVNGNTTLGNAAADTITCNTGLRMYEATADPCGTIAANTLFIARVYGGTANSHPCYCNVFGVDLKVDGTSASCF